MRHNRRGASTTLPAAPASHGDTKTWSKDLDRIADDIVGVSTSEQDEYGSSETRLKNASIRGTDPPRYLGITVGLGNADAAFL